MIRFASRRRLTAEDVARRVAPHLEVVSVSQPVPSLRRHNLVVLTHSPEHARRLVLSLESLEPDDDKLATVSLGPRETADEPSYTVDAERVGPWLAPAIIRGALFGALVGAALFGGIAAIIGVTGWGLVGAALGGAALVGVFGIVWMSFARLGGSDAFRQTFVDDSVTELTVISVHTDDLGEIEAARAAMADGGAPPPDTVLDVNARGQAKVATGWPP